jgi:hypothetical protein
MRRAPFFLAGASLGYSKLRCDGVRRVFCVRFSSLFPLAVASAAFKRWRRSSKSFVPLQGPICIFSYFWEAFAVVPGKVSLVVGSFVLLSGVCCT